MTDRIAGRFELIEPIAKGGSGAVWRAWDHKVAAECAAKVLRQRDSADLLRFVREQSVKLEHPHVVAPYGWAAEDEYVAIAMPLVSGGTLEAALQDNGAVAEFVAEELLWQLLQALQFVHARGWIHRDVKPANLLLEPTGSDRPWARLADFGIAVRAQDARLTHTGTVVGTPGYLPHEAYGPVDPSTTVDLYAAGVTAVRLVEPHVDLSTPIGPEHARELFPESPALREHVAGLLAESPAERTVAFHRALRELAAGAAQRAQRTAMTAQGEPFEVFDVLAATTERELSVIHDGAVLPDAPGRESAAIAWHPVGRGAARPAEETAVIRLGDHPLEPFRLSQTDPPAATDRSAAPDHPAQPATMQPAATQPAAVRASVLDDDSGDDAGEGAQRRRRIPWPWRIVVLAAAIFALVAGFFWLGPALMHWVTGETPPLPGTSTSAPAEPSAPASTAPSGELSPRCTEQEDGSVRCVVEP